MRSCAHQGWLELRNLQGRLDIVPLHGFAGPWRPPHGGQVEPALPACAEGEKRAAAAKSHAENGH